MSHAVTIDNYDVKIHERYATDQAGYDANILKDTGEVSSHFSLAREQTRLLTKWEELFETHLHRHPFAFFSPPPFTMGMRQAFFTHVLASEFDWEDDDAEEEEEKLAQQYRKKIKAKIAKHLPAAIFERDRSSLLSLIDCIQTLNGFLTEVHARKLQYQKG